VFYNEDDFLPQTKEKLSKVLTPDQFSLIQFVRIEFTFPANWNLEAAEASMREHTDERGGKLNGIVWKHAYPGYQHMISFWMKHIFEHPLVRDLDYFWRMDTDSFLKSDVLYDLFQFMDDNKYVYGYRSFESERWEVMLNFLKFYTDYAKQNNIVIPPYVNLPADVSDPNPPGFSHMQYYNNFEIVHVPSFINNAAFQQFNDAVYQLNGIYKYRWGDGPVRYYGLNLFFPPEKLHEFCDILYVHQNEKRINCVVEYKEGKWVQTKL